MIIIMIFSLIKKIPVQVVAIFIRRFFISRKDQPPYIWFHYYTPFCFPSFFKAFTYASLSVIVVNVCQFLLVFFLAHNYLNPWSSYPSPAPPKQYNRIPKL